MPKFYNSLIFEEKEIIRDIYKHISYMTINRLSCLFKTSKYNIYTCVKDIKKSYKSPQKEIPLTKETKLKISKKLKGRIFTKEHKNKLSISATKMWKNVTIRKEIINSITKYNIPENKEMVRKLYLKEHSCKRVAKIMNTNDYQIYKIVKDLIENESDIMKRLWKDKKFRKCRLKIQGGLFQSGNKHPNWNNGSSFILYPINFNNNLRKKIRERDNYICKECGNTEKKIGHKLSVHHIDYNKKNCNKNNLISLCKKCHSKTNFKREDWIKYFKKKMGEKHGIRN